MKEGIKWVMEGGKLTSYQLKSGRPVPGEVIIPSEVTAIGDFVFTGCEAITSVVLHDGVTSVGVGTFMGCTGIKHIDIPGSVDSIGDNAFLGCVGMLGVTIRDGVTSIGEKAFFGCTNMMSVYLSNSVTVIGKSAFDGCFPKARISIEPATEHLGMLRESGFQEETVQIVGRFNSGLTGDELKESLKNNTTFEVLFPTNDIRPSRKLFSGNSIDGITTTDGAIDYLSHNGGDENCIKDLEALMVHNNFNDNAERLFGIFQLLLISFESGEQHFPYEVLLNMLAVRLAILEFAKFNERDRKETYELSLGPTMLGAFSHPKEAGTLSQAAETLQKGIDGMVDAGDRAEAKRVFDLN